MSRVVVTGSEYPAGLAAVRALDRAGFEVWAAISSPKALGARSRAAAGTVAVPDPRTDPDGFTRALAKASRDLGAVAVLPGTEAALLALAGKEDEFPSDVAVGSPPEQMIRRATDKTALALLSLRAGMDVPPTRIVMADDPATTADLTFPAMVKPLRSELITNGHLQRFEATRIEDRSELDGALRALPDDVGIVQTYLEGRLISVNGVAYKGELYACNQHVVHRVWPDRCGGAVFAETIPLPEDRRERTAAFMRELGWSGVFNLQLIEYDGREHVIDLNPRFYVSLTLAVAAGLNLPAIWLRLLLGEPVTRTEGKVGVHYRYERNDQQAIVAQLRRGDLSSARDLLPRRHTVHALFSARDPRPGLTLVGETVAALRRRRYASKSKPGTAPPSAPAPSPDDVRPASYEPVP